MRMLMNNLDPAVAENPAELVVYGGVGRAARDWDSFDRIVGSLKTLEKHQTLLVQSGKPVGVETHERAPPFYCPLQPVPHGRRSSISQSSINAAS